MPTNAASFTHSYTPRQERANSLTAGTGAVLVAAGTALLVVLACLRGSAWHIVSFSVYGGTLFLLYLTATLYHSFRSPGVKRFFEILDHSAIFLLIAGTYTPFTLVTLRGTWGWPLFGVVWGLGVVGIIYKIFFTGRHPVFSTLLYIGMGWMAVLALKPLMAALPADGVALLLLGGAFYSLGTIFYHREKFYYSHAVWHLFVLAGSLCHYLTVLFYVLPKPV
ncbi:MAG TPA: hemolysin III family protein [bacterium]|nr:hemolysin III family protein [bacterium]